MDVSAIARTVDFTKVVVCSGILVIAALEVARGQNPDRERGGYSSYSTPIDRGTRSVGPVVQNTAPADQQAVADDVQEPPPPATEQAVQQQPSQAAADVETAGVAGRPN